MPIATLDLILRRLRILAARPGDGQSDAELLNRFSQSRDERAFEQILVRHGPRVWGLCRQLLKDSHAAEDAFQATFMVLARRVGAIRQPDSLGCWLHGVAVRVASKLRKPAIFTPLAENTTVSTGEVAHETAVAREFVALLHEELGRLPDRLRNPVVLCYLNGRTRDEAAKQLGWSLGTLKRRLEQGRAALHSRLTRRGVNLSAVILTAGLTECGVQSAAPTTLLVATARSALSFAAGTVATSTSIALAKSVLYSMGWSPMKWAAACLLAAGTLTAGVGYYLHSAEPQPPKSSPPIAAAPSNPAPPPVDRFGDPLPDGTRARLGTVRWRGPGPLHQLAFSQDGKIAVGAASANGVQFWDADTGLPIDRGFRFGDRSTGGAQSVALSPDGSILATATSVRLRDGSTVRLWDVAMGKELPFPKQDASVAELYFAPDGKSLAATMMMSNTNLVMLWEIPSGKLIGKLDHLKAGDRPGLNRTIAALVAGFSNDGRELFTNDRIHKEIVVWDTSNGARTRTIAIPAGNREICAVLSPDGKTIATEVLGRVTIVDSANGNETGHVDTGTKDTYLSLAYADGGKLLAGRTATGIDFIDLATGKKLTTAKEAPIPSGGHLYAPPNSPRVMLSYLSQRAVRIWDAKTAAELTDSSAHTQGVVTLSAAGDQKAITSAADWGDPRVLQWDRDNLQTPARTLFNFPEAQFGHNRIAAFSPKGDRVAWTGEDGEPAAARGGRPRIRQVVNILEAPSGRLIHSIDNPGSPCEALAWSRDGLTLGSDADRAQKAIQIWDVTTGKPKNKLKSESELATELTFSPDNQKLAVAYRAPSALWIWDVTTGQVSQKLDPKNSKWEAGPTCVAFSPDGLTVAAADMRGHVFRFETASGKPQPVLDGPSKGLTKCLFTTDGKLLIAGGYDGSVWVWDANTGSLRRKSAGHRGPITSMVMTPDGKTLATGSADTTILLWDTSGW